MRGGRPRGERLVADTPFGHWCTQTFVAGLLCGALEAPRVVDGAMHRQAFDIYVETQLVPTLDAGDVVILGNLAAHESRRAAPALKARRAWLLFVPPYSPDLNPIGMAFSKLKADLRAVASLTIDALGNAEGDRYPDLADGRGAPEIRPKGYKWDWTIRE